MKGTIKITVVDTGKIEMEVDGNFNALDRLCLIDSLVIALVEDPKERAALGSVLRGGGVNEVFDCGPDVVKIPLDFYKTMTKKEGNEQ